MNRDLGREAVMRRRRRRKDLRGSENGGVAHLVDEALEVSCSRLLALGNLGEGEVSHAGTEAGEDHVGGNLRNGQKEEDEREEERDLEVHVEAAEELLSLGREDRGRDEGGLGVKGGRMGRRGRLVMDELVLVGAGEIEGRRVDGLRIAGVEDLRHPLHNVAHLVFVAVGSHTAWEEE